MAWLSVVAVIGSAALAGIAVKALRWWDDLDSGDPRKWINRMADESRKKKVLRCAQDDKRRCYRWIFMGS